MRNVVAWGLAMIVTAGVATAPRAATACGGTFCDAPAPGQPPMPVAQTGENVLFVMSGGTVEAHVQIQYSGDPARFAWIVPVPTVPELEVGSEPLFDALLTGTVPTFNVAGSADACGSSPGYSSGGVGCSSSDSSGTAAYSAGGGGYAPPDWHGAEPDATHQSVGAYDVVVLQPASAAELTTWLTDNSYLPDPAAGPILTDYLSKGYVFVAVKLNPDAGSDEIHPLVIRYTGDSPCVPLKLTSIAAKQDMGVRTFFLGQHQVVPTGEYKSVSIDPARFDWVDLAQNYDDAVGRAVDAPLANGHAFVTEYAGTDSVVARNGIYSPGWDASAFAAASATDVVSILTNQGLASCAQASSCAFYHPLVLPLLRRYLPAPAGVGEGAFYSCLSCYQDQIDAASWDAAAFGADFDTLIVQPGEHAISILDGNPFLTRLYTTISPAEMTADPEFREWPGSLPGTSATLSATARLTCAAQTVMELGDGNEVAMTSPLQWPAFDASLPWAETVTEYPAAGDSAIPLADNSKQIKSVLDALEQGQPRPGPAVERRRLALQRLGLRLPRAGGHAARRARRVRVPGDRAATSLLAPAQLKPGPGIIAGDAREHGPGHGAGGGVARLRRRREARAGHAGERAARKRLRDHQAAGPGRGRPRGDTRGRHRGARRVQRRAGDQSLRRRRRRRGRAVAAHRTAAGRAAARRGAATARRAGPGRARAHREAGRRERRRAAGAGARLPARRLPGGARRRAGHARRWRLRRGRRGRARGGVADRAGAVGRQREALRHRGAVPLAARARRPRRRLCAMRRRRSGAARRGRRRRPARGALSALASARHASARAA